MTAPEAPSVTREDRDAAQALCASGWTHAIEAFARHRTTALAAKEAENADWRGKVEVLSRAVAERDKQLAAERAKVERLREALEGMVTDAEDDPCWYDHHGYCQAHGLNDPCEMAIARATLAETQPDERTDNG